MKNRNKFFYIMIALLLLAAAGLVFILAPGSDPNTPPVLLPSPVPTDTASDAPGDSAADLAVAVTPETVQTVIRTLHRIDCYSRTLTISDYWTGGSRSRSIDVWSSGENLRLTVHSGSAPQEHLLFRGDEKWLWYSDSDEIYHGTAVAGDADAYQTLLTYEDVLSLPTRAILDAGYREYEGTYCIFLRCSFGSFGYESECFVDPATGLLMGELCYDGDNLVYSMSSSVPDLSIPDDSLFAAP